MSAHSAERPAFTKAMAGIPELLRGGKLPDAKKRLDQLEAMLKAPPAPPPPPPGGGPKYAELNATWKQVSQQAAQMMVANPARRTALTQAMAGIQEHACRAGNWVKPAQKRIEQLQVALSEVKEVEVQSAAWKWLEDKVNQAIAAYPEHKAELGRAGSGIAEMIRVGKVQLAKLTDGQRYGGSQSHREKRANARTAERGESGGDCRIVGRRWAAVYSA